jgi:DNA-binding CsgD family transcriptional regulator
MSANARLLHDRVAVPGTRPSPRAARDPLQAPGQPSFARHKEWQCFELRKAGASYQEIARAMGLSHEGARKICKRVFRKLDEHTQESAREYRTLELGRIGALIKALWKRGLEGELKAIDRLTKLIDLEAELCGTKAASKIEVTGAEGGPLSVAVRPDFTGFSMDELQQMRGLAVKARASQIAASPQTTIDVEAAPSEAVVSTSDK